jgi:hypothetical protein
LTTASRREVFTWTRFLPEDNRRLFITEFAGTLRAVEIWTTSPRSHI